MVRLNMYVEMTHFYKNNFNCFKNFEDIAQTALKPSNRPKFKEA